MAASWLLNRLREIEEKSKSWPAWVFEQPLTRRDAEKIARGEKLRSHATMANEDVLTWAETAVGLLFDANYSEREALFIQNTIERLAAEVRELRKRKDGAYYERNQVVAALAKCFPSGIARTAIEGWSEDWHGCVYIDLPTGQVSWHFHDSHAHLFAGLPPYSGSWDGHDTPEKYRRLAGLDGELRKDRERLNWLFAAKRAYLFAPSRHDKSVGRYLEDRDDIDAEMGGSGGA